jgi:predicted nucleotidyltransferase
MAATATSASEIVDRILAVARPQKIILFGSRARGAHRPASDYDLLIIQPSVEPRYRRAVPYYRALAALVRSQNQMGGVEWRFVTVSARQAWSRDGQTVGTDLPGAQGKGSG